MALPDDLVPTVLRLIDHLHRTRRDSRLLTDAIDAQPASVRRAIVTTIQK